MVFSTYFKLSLNLAIRGPWADQSCFCWLDRASPSLAAKNIINLIPVLTIWWCPCVQLALVLLEEGACYDHCVLGKTVRLCPASFCTPGQTCLLLCFCIAIPYDGKDLLLVLVLEGLVGLHRTSHLQLLRHQWLGHRPGLLWCWMVCLKLTIT